VDKVDRKAINSSRRSLLGFVGVTAAGSVLAGPVKAQSSNQIVSARAGKSMSGALQSAGALAFGPNNVLFVADITGAAVHAFVLRPTDITSQVDVELGNFHNFEGRDLVRGLDQKLAAAMGTT
jgi:hypothetical protein